MNLLIKHLQFITHFSKSICTVSRVAWHHITLIEVAILGENLKSIESMFSSKVRNIRFALHHFQYGLIIYNLTGKRFNICIYPQFSLMLKNISLFQLQVVLDL